MKRKQRKDKGKEEADEFSNSEEQREHEEAVARTRHQRELVEARQREKAEKKAQKEAQKKTRKEAAQLEQSRPQMIPVPSRPPPQRADQDARPHRAENVCQIPVRWPPIAAPIRRLRNIGELFEERWAQEDVVTLRDLVTLVTGNTAGQNRRIFQRVFLNPNQKTCVPRSRSRNHLVRTKYWANPWPNPPYHNVGNRAGLGPGDFSYCVRQWNKCGWKTVEAYLRHQLDAADLVRIPVYQQRNHYCRRNQPGWCLERQLHNDDEKRHEDEEEDADDEEEGQEDDEARHKDDIEPISIEAYIALNPPQIFNPHQLNENFRAKIGKAFEMLQILDPETKIAIALYFLKKNEPKRIKFSLPEVVRLIGRITVDNLRSDFFKIKQDGSIVKFSALKKTEDALLTQLGVTRRLFHNKTQNTIHGSARVQHGGRPAEIRYYIGPGNPLSFQRWIHKTLNHPTKGISAQSGIKYTKTTDKDSADILVSLASQEKINQECGFSKLSCSVVSYDTAQPDRIMFSLENWNGSALPKFKGTLSAYRTYLINHEFLHCRPFNLDHPRALVCSFQPTPVMHQQSLGLPPNCLPNVWPLKRELRLRKEE